MSRTFFSSIAFACAMIAASIGYKYFQGPVGSPDFEGRTMMMLTGLILAFFANAIPKLNKSASAGAQTISRVAGWAFTLAGLGISGVWALAPSAALLPASIVVMGGAIAWVAAACLSLRRRANA